LWRPHHRALHHQRPLIHEGHVLEDGRPQHHPAEARIGEDRLHHHHARDEVVDLEQDYRDGIDHGVADGVADDHAAKGHALEDGGANVGALHHLDHRGADHAHYVARVEQHDHRHGQDELRGHRPPASRHHGRGAGQPAQGDHEYAHQEHAESELGHGGDHRAEHEDG